jgi:DNA-binding transcriptional LysR family regulator
MWAKPAMVEVRLLEHALAVANQGSFALAAHTLGISQPALSRSIQSLEAQLQVQLFERGRRRIEPTDAGQVFLERARDLVARHAELSRAMGLFEPIAGPAFTLACGPYVADLVAGVALGGIVAEHADIQWRLRVESWADAVKLVRSREADLGAAEISQIDDDPDLEVTPLGEIPGSLVVRQGHPLLKGRSHRLEEVLSYPLVSTSRLPPRLLEPFRAGRGNSAAQIKAGFPAILCDHVSVMRVVVAHSDAVGMFILPLIESEVAAGSLVPLSCDVPWLHTQFGIVRLRKNPLPPHGRRLVALLEQAAGELAATARLLARPRSQSGSR